VITAGTVTRVRGLVYCTGSLIFMVGPLVWFSFKLLPESFDYFAEQNEG